MATQHLVVDTDIFIWLTRGKKEAALYGPLVSGKRIVLSFATVAELWRGAYTQKYNDANKTKLEADIGLAVVVPPSNQLTHEWAHLTAEARAASHFEIPLLTGNRAHFQDMDRLQLVPLPS